MPGLAIEAVEKPKAKERERIRKGKQAGAKCGKLPHLNESKTRDAVGKAGKLLKGMDKAKGGRPGKTDSIVQSVTLDDLGIEPTQSMRWQRMASVPDKVTGR